MPILMQQHSGTSKGIVKVISFVSLGSWAGRSDGSKNSGVPDAMQKQVVVDVLVLVLVDVEVVLGGGAGGVVVVCGE